MIGIIANMEIEINKNYIEKIRCFFNKKGIECIVADVVQDKFENYIYLLKPVDKIIVLGGDGTVLQAVQNAISIGAPIIAFNTGTLGFLAEYDIESFEEIFDRVIRGKYILEKRSLVEVYKNNEVLDICLNDAVIAREGFSRIVSIEAIANDMTISNYHGDGVIISTATGSTGYNLSLNGPILSPNCKNIILTPIANHSLFSRTVILSENDILKIKILHSRKTQAKEAILTCDGRKNIDLHSGDELMIKASELYVEFIKVDKKNFFKICKEKLM